MIVAMTKSWPRLLIGMCVGVMAWTVMPDGPWYRELGCGVLFLVSFLLKAEAGGEA